MHRSKRFTNRSVSLRLPTPPASTCQHPSHLKLMHTRPSVKSGPAPTSNPRSRPKLPPTARAKAGSSRVRTTSRSIFLATARRGLTAARRRCLPTRLVRPVDELPGVVRRTRRLFQRVKVIRNQRGTFSPGGGHLVRRHGDAIAVRPAPDRLTPIRQPKQADQVRLVIADPVQQFHQQQQTRIAFARRGWPQRWKILLEPAGTRQTGVRRVTRQETETRQEDPAQRIVGKENAKATQHHPLPWPQGKLVNAGAMSPLVGWRNANESRRG